jgi:hypothetical protein
MIELIHKNEVVKLPEDMTVELYQKFMKEQKKFTDEPIELISLFTNLPVSKLKNLSPKTIQMVNSYVISKMEIPDLKELVTTFIHNGIEYGLHTDIGKMAWGAWVDLEVYSSENIVDNIHKIMSVLYRPVTKKTKKGYEIEPYDSESIADRAEEFLTLPISYWFRTSDFFLSVANLSIINIKASLERKNKMNQLMMKGTKILPKWVQEKLLRGSTFN